MDPDQLLSDLKELAQCIINGELYNGVENDLAQGVLDLDKWLRFGGFLPAAWATGRILGESPF